MKKAGKLLRNQWDRTAAVVLVFAGLVALFAGWSQASDSIFIFEQIPYLISGALFGVILVGLGATSWLSADMRDEWRKLNRVEEALRQREERVDRTRREPEPVRTRC